MFELINVENAIKESLKLNILSQFETGNVLFDSVIRIFVITLITSITGKILMLLTDVGDFTSFFSFSFKETYEKLYLWFKCPKKLKIVGSRYVELRYMHSRFDFSLRFKSVLNKIVESLETRKENSKLINKIKELQVREATRFYDMPNEEAEFNFIVDQYNYFKLDDNVFCNITTFKDNVESEGKKTQVCKEEYTIEIWSPDMDCKQLLKYVEKITDEYEKKQKEKLEGKRFYFKFDGTDNESGQIKWAVSDFNSKRKLEHVFFEKKAETIHFLEKFISEKEFYENVGKPWQLGILLEGEPGCGKTSFIGALANHLNRSIKDLQFNRMKTIDDLEGAFNCISYNNKDMNVDKVIMVAEDFDCMTNIAKSRKLIEKEKEDAVNQYKKKQESLNEQMKTMKSDEAKAILCAVASQDDSPVVIEAPKMDPSKSRDITLSNLLNILDGVNTFNGRIIVFTTNFPDTLDDAFLRSGRIDLRIKLGRHPREVLYEQMQHWYKCLDEFYPNNNYSQQFEECWTKYEMQIEDRKHLPCDIANILQKYGQNIEQVFSKLVECV